MPEAGPCVLRLLNAAGTSYLKKRSQRAERAEFEHDTQIVGTLIPDSTKEPYEIRMVEWRHDLRANKFERNREARQRKEILLDSPT